MIANCRTIGGLTFLFNEELLRPEELNQLKGRLLNDIQARREFTDTVVEDGKLKALDRIAELLGFDAESLWAECSDAHQGSPKPGP